MNATLVALSFLLAGGLSAHGQADSPKEIPDFDVRPKVVIGPDDLTDVDAEHDWKSWLEKNFPDASDSWPKAAAAAFTKAAGEEKWDFVAKGDFDRDGAPTGLLIRTERLPRFGQIIVKKLAVLKWQGGRWTEMLWMADGKVFRRNGKLRRGLSRPSFFGYGISFFVGHPEEKSHPGAVINMYNVNSEGRGLTDGMSFCFMPEKKKYASLEGDGDWETE
ncbi:MAG TPA: hypothetical protein VN915_12015 [Elusimicrobiota bacterium]|nr:hypothetical protein [Elusimicrobiota bacterium]